MVGYQLVKRVAEDTVQSRSLSARWQTEAEMSQSLYTAPAGEANATCVIKPVNRLARKSSAAQGLKELKVQVQIMEANSNKQVCCKSDGMRFAGADTTVKLRQDTKYLISITTSPATAVTVEQAELKHRQAECQEPSMCCCFPQARAYATMTELEWCPAVKVPLSEKGSASNTQRSVYEVDWDCNMDLTGTGMRGELALDVAVQDFGCVTIPIMAKVYRSSDNSAAHGMPLHSITYNYGRSGLTGEVKLYSSQYNK